MQPLEELSASSLKTLLNEETRTFVSHLDKGYSPELEDCRNRLIAIFRQLVEKEKADAAPLTWSKHSSGLTTDASV